MDLRLLLAVSFWIVWKIVLKRRPSSGQQLVIKVNSAILKSQWSIIFEIPDDNELWMTLGKRIVTNIISNTSLSNTCPQQTRNMQRGTENVLIWAITTGTKWDRELRAVTSFRILNTDWSKWTCGAQTLVSVFGYHFATLELTPGVVAFLYVTCGRKINRAWSITTAKYLFEVDSSFPLITLSYLNTI